MAHSTNDPSDPWRTGDAEAVCALLEQPFPKNPADHPIYDLLKWASNFGSPERGVALLNLIWEKGFDPSLVEGPHRKWGSLTTPARVRLCAPARSGESIQATASLLSRALLLPTAHRDAWLSRLDELGVRPQPRDWRTALREGQVHWIRRWQTAGYPMPPVQELAQMAVRNLALPSNQNHARVMEVLVELGWTPKPEDLELAHAKCSIQAMHWLLKKAPLLSRGMEADVRLSVWNGFWNNWNSQVGPKMVEGLLVDSAWRATAQEALPDEEWWALPGVLRLSPRKPPAWLSVLHARPGAQDDSSFSNRHQCWSRAQALLDLPEEGWDGWTHGEMWAATWASPHVVQKSFPEAALPNPKTGRWPAGGAPMNTLLAWVEAGGGLEAALADPSGPLAEWVARVAARETGMSDRGQSLKEWALRSLELAPSEALKGTWQGCSLESWCAVNADLKKAWRQRTGVAPRAHLFSPLEQLWPAACAGDVEGVVKAKARLGESGKNAAAAAADLEGLGWHRLMCAGGGPLLSKTPTKTARDRQLRQVEVGFLLADAGWTLPAAPESWRLWKEVWKVHVDSGDAAPRLMELWPLMKKWPTCLTDVWLQGVLTLCGRASGSKDERARIVRSLVGSTLSRAQDPEAVALAAVRGLVDPSGAGRLLTDSSGRAVESSVVLEAIWGALPGSPALSALPFGTYLEQWQARFQKSTDEDGGDSLAEFWAQSPVLRALALADGLRLSVDAPDAPPLARRCRL